MITPWHVIGLMKHSESITEADMEPMADAEYNELRERAFYLIHELRSFDAWRFKHEAKRHGERDLGQWLWAMHLEAREAELSQR